MSVPHHALLITVTRESEYDGHNVMFGGQQAYFRPYDGCDDDDVIDEACKALGELLREKLGFPEEEPESIW